MEQFINTIRQVATERGMLAVETGTDWASITSADTTIELAFYTGADDVTEYWNASVFEHTDSDVTDFLADSYGSTPADLYRFLTTYI